MTIAAANNQLFGISYHLDSNLLVKASDKENTCNENPEEDLSLGGGGDKDGSSCMVTPQADLLLQGTLKKHHRSDKQEE